MFTGELAGIYLGAEKAKPLSSVTTVRAVAGKGLEGDRYYKKAGTFTKLNDPDRPDRQVTLIEEEALAAAAEAGAALKPEESRRNLLTRGVPLNHLVGREFIVGEVRLRGLLLCEPCKHLEALTRPGARERLIHLSCPETGEYFDGVYWVDGQYV
ncbi:MAG: hypothetical protein KGL53_01285, partial [Elusimicrobia bacterium]|nr:hypothetical protein [Elusimicrobiota bacterium]